jgi:hypothetical protein
MSQVAVMADVQVAPVESVMVNVHVPSAMGVELGPVLHATGPYRKVVPSVDRLSAFTSVVTAPVGDVLVTVTVVSLDPG